MGLSDKAQDSLQGLGRVVAFCYAVAVFISSLGGASQTWENAVPLDKLNQQAFKNLSMNDTRRNLGDPSRGIVWKDRSSNMARDIIGNRQPVLDWLPFSGYRADLGSVMENAKIAVVPHVTAGQPATLVVDEDHGCLLVDYEKTDGENVDQARILLDAFKENAHGRYDYLGIYTVDADSGNTVTYKAAGKATAESEKEDRASRYCVLAAPLAP